MILMTMTIEMITRIIKSCSVRLNGEIKNLKAGETLTLPSEKAKRMVAAGYAEVIKPGAEEYRRYALEILRIDPKGGCWDWIVHNKPDLWQNCQVAFNSGNLDTAKDLFIHMVNLWSTVKPQ